MSACCVCDAETEGETDDNIAGTDREAAAETEEGGRDREEREGAALNRRV